MQEPRRVCSKCGESYDPDVIFCPKDGTPLGGRKTEVADDPYLGLSVAGQFRIEQIIGIGAMGRVYRAHQSGIERDVAIKILHRELLRNPTVITRFHREAKVASRLAHPNVVQVLMTGQLERSSGDVGGEAYLVMEYLDGISLRSAMAAKGGAMPLPRALHVVLQVCDAVGEAHARGIVHRDLKPENVMLVRRGDDDDFVKVLDFGVARIDFADSSIATQAGVIFGTARYISPEGAQGAPVGPAGDVYSIATMLFQCLSGETPFDGESPVAILVKHTSQTPPDVRSLPRSSYVPESLARVIADNLAKDPAERCRDAREFGRAVARAARDCGLSPDDLVLRSTLLGDPTGALQLASIERTRAMNLTPEQARGEAPIETAKTQLVEPDQDFEETNDPEASPTIVEAEPPASRRSLASEPGTSPPEEEEQRVSRVEPTLSDEPASFVTASGSLAPFSERRSGVSLPFVPPRASQPDLTWEPPAETRSRLRPILLVLAFFIVGASLSAGVAHKLGAFDQPETVEDYAARANAAIAVNAWDAPAGSNVKDITDNALKRWPKAPPILTVRRDAARRLVLRARQLRDEQRDTATRYAELAVELDPANDTARALALELRQPSAPSSADVDTPPPRTAEADTREAKSSTSPRKRDSGRATSSGAATTATKPATSSAPTDPAPPPSEAPDKPGAKPGEAGRWL
jgi:serine/threonine-protein kinase